jgi:hypothetical protein
MRCYVLRLENLHELAVITPGDIIEIASAVGKETWELAQFLEGRFPGITRELASRYLDRLLLTMPTGILPSQEEVNSFVNNWILLDSPIQEIRDLCVEHWKDQVNVQSPEWAKRSMMAMIDFALGEFAESLHSAGFAQNTVANPNFEEALQGSSGESIFEDLLAVERAKAEVLAEIIRERRLAG